VLFLDHVGVIGGAELAMLDVARAYRDTSTVVLFADGPFRGRLASQGIRVQVLEGSRALHAVRRETRVPSFGAVRGLASLVQRLVPIAREYDCLHANTQKAFVTACVTGLLARRPVIWELHDLLATDRFSRAHIRLDVALANHCTVRVIANSRAAAAAFVEEGGRPDLVRVVHNGIAAAPFDAVTDDEIAEARRELNAGDAPLVGVFSRLGEGKGQDVVLEALAQVPRAHLLLVGDALFGEHAYRASLGAQAARLGLTDRVHFLGFRSDVPRLMRTVDIVALTSSVPEAFGRVVVEGMLARRPVIATGVGGVPEIVTDGTGVLVPPGDAPALASALTRLLSDPAFAGEVARKGRLRATTHFTVEAMVDRKISHIEAAIRKQAA
jgi:glycosyltransferase involved in cell wall biosynthesis